MSATENVQERVRIFAKEICNVKVNYKYIDVSLADAKHPTFNGIPFKDPIIRDLHQRGINIRYLGLLVLEMQGKNTKLINFLLSVMTVRIMKNLWRKRMRKANGKRIYELCLNETEAILNSFIIEGKNHEEEEQGNKLWKRITVLGKVMFGKGVIINYSKILEPILLQARHAVTIWWVIIRFCETCGIVLSQASVQCLTGGYSILFSRTNFAGFVPNIKYPPILDYYAGLHFLFKARKEERIGSRLTLMKSASQRLLNAINYEYPNVRELCAQAQFETIKFDCKYIGDWEEITDQYYRRWEKIKYLPCTPEHLDFLYSSLWPIFIQQCHEEEEQIDVTINLSKNSLVNDLLNCFVSTDQTKELTRVICGYLNKMSAINHEFNKLKQNNERYQSIDPEKIGPISLSPAMLKKLLEEARSWDIPIEKKWWFFYRYFSLSELIIFSKENEINLQDNIHSLFLLMPHPHVLTLFYHGNTDVDTVLDELKIKDKKFSHILNMADGEGGTCYVVAREKRYFHVTEFLKNKGAVKNIPRAFICRDPPAIQRCLQNSRPMKILLTTVDLKNMRIQRLGYIPMLAITLEESPQLLSLDLANNEINCAGASALATALHRNTTLTSLDLGYNKIGPKGAAAIATALYSNTSLTILILQWNKIGSQANVYYDSDEESKDAIATQNMDKTKESIDGTSAIATALYTNHSLTYISLANNRISNNGAKFLVEALKVNDTLNKIHLSGNDFGDSGYVALATVLWHNTKLKIYFGVEMLPAIIAAKEIMAEEDPTKELPPVAQAIINEAFLDNFKKATHFMEQEKYDLALKQFQVLNYLDKKDMEVHMLMGYTLLNLNQPEMALTCFDDVLKIEPENFRGWCFRGLVFDFMKTRGCDEAEKCYEMARKINSLGINEWYEFIEKKFGKICSIFDSENSTLCKISDEVELIFLNPKLQVSSYTGGSQADTGDVLIVSNVLSKGTRNFHCSQPGDNFDLVLEAKEEITITHVVVIQAPRCTCPIKSGAVHIYKEKPTEEQLGQWKNLEGETQEGNSPHLLFVIPPDKTYIEVELENWQTGKFIHVKFISCYSEDEEDKNIDVAFVGFVGYVGTPPPKKKLGEIPVEFDIIPIHLTLWNQLCNELKGEFFQRRTVTVFEGINDSSVSAKQAMRAVAETKEFKDKITFFWAPKSSDLTKKVLDYVGWQNNQTIIGAIDLNSRKNYLYPSDVFTKESVQEFVNNVINGTATIFIRSEDRPLNDRDPDNPTTYQLTTNSFTELVIQSEHDWLVLVWDSSNWSSGLCSTIDTLAFLLADVPSIKVGKLNSELNLVPKDYFPENNYPNIKFFSQKDKNTPIEFSGESSLEVFLQFVHRVMHDPFDLEKYKANIETMVQLQEIKIEARVFLKHAIAYFKDHANVLTPEEKSAFEASLSSLQSMLDSSTESFMTISRLTSDLKEDATYKKLDDAQIKAKCKNVISVCNVDHHQALLEQAKAKGLPVIIGFLTSWCPPSRFILPHFQNFSEEFPNILFLKIDGDECQELCVEYDISAFPTFFGILGDNNILSFSGSSVERLKTLLGKLSE